MARMLFSLVATAATIAALAAPTTASAELVTDCDNLQAALDEFDVVTVAEGVTCGGHWDLPNRTITLEGQGQGATLTGNVGEGGRTQILYGDSVGSTTIRNLTFEEGNSSDSNEQTNGGGGAIYIEGESPVTIEGNQFYANDADARGGAVALILDNQVFAPVARGDASAVTLRGNTFGDVEDGNDAEGDGGAVYVTSFFRDVVVDDNTFTENDSGNRGGGLRIDPTQFVSLTGNTFEANESGNDGGGAAIDTCEAEISSNVFEGNEAVSEDFSLEGGGLYLDGFCSQNGKAGRSVVVTAVTQSGNAFANNRIGGEFSQGDGAGEFIGGLSTSSTNDGFVGNVIDATSGGRGGGLAFEAGSQSFTARNLVATGNEIAPADFSPPTARGASVQNTFGGGLFIGGFGPVTVENSTVQGNVAAFGPGIAGTQQQSERGLQFQSLALHNSIVFGNGTGGDEDVFGFAGREFLNSDVCVAGVAPSGSGSAGNICADPKLAGATDDGNVDQTAASPTVNKGDNALVDADLTTDYAGDARVIAGKVDIGADEFKAATVEPEPDEPEPTTQPGAQTPPAAGGVQGVQQKSCTSRRAFRIRIRVPKGKKARSATVRVNGKKVKVVRGKRLRAPVRLKGLPRGRFKVRITIRLANGRKISGVRTYHTCIPKLPGDGPPKV